MEYTSSLAVVDTYTAQKRPPAPKHMQRKKRNARNTSEHRPPPYATEDDARPVPPPDAPPPASVDPLADGSQCAIDITASSHTPPPEAHTLVLADDAVITVADAGAPAGDAGGAPAAPAARVALSLASWEMAAAGMPARHAAPTEDRVAEALGCGLAGSAVSVVVAVSPSRCHHDAGVPGASPMAVADATVSAPTAAPQPPVNAPPEPVADPDAQRASRELLALLVAPLNRAVEYRLPAGASPTDGAICMALQSLGLPATSSRTLAPHLASAGHASFDGVLQHLLAGGGVASSTNPAEPLILDGAPVAARTKSIAHASLAVATSPPVLAEPERQRDRQSSPQATRKRRKFEVSPCVAVAKRHRTLADEECAAGPEEGTAGPVHVSEVTASCHRQEEDAVPERAPEPARAAVAWNIGEAELLENAPPQDAGGAQAAPKDAAMRRREGVAFVV